MTLFATKMETRDRGTIIGKPGQWPSELVTEVYGASNGMRHWGKDGIEYLIVAPARESVMAKSDADPVPTTITTHQRVIDVVYSFSQERVTE